jgi:hypothetical protein
MGPAQLTYATVQEALQPSRFLIYKEEVIRMTEQGFAD